MLPHPDATAALPAPLPRLKPAATASASRPHGDAGTSNLTAPSALCVTGQLRAVPLAYENWKEGALNELLGPSQPHMFFVASDSNSAHVWKQWLTTVPSLQEVVIIPSVALVRDSNSSDWTHRIASDGGV